MSIKLFLTSALLFPLCSYAAPVKETPNNSKDTDLHCIFTSYRIRSNQNVEDVKIKICTQGSVKTEKNSKQSLSERKSK